MRRKNVNVADNKRCKYDVIVSRAHGQLRRMSRKIEIAELGISVEILQRLSIAFVAVVVSVAPSREYWHSARSAGSPAGA